METENKYKILIVDDEPEILATTENLLQKRGYLTATANNGVTALAAIEKERPDLILADVLMPEMDGFTFYKQLKGNEFTAEIPVLIITGRGQMEESFKVIGVDGFITKPFSPDDLVTEAEHILRLYQSKKGIKSKGKNAFVPKVLAAGSERGVLENMSQQASRGGFKFEGAVTSADAIAKAVKFVPDIIFVDVQLTDMPAIELIDIIKKLPQMASKPVVGYSYYQTEDLQDTDLRRKVLNIDAASKKALNNGVNQYMGRYSHLAFVKTIMDYFKNEQG